MWTSLDVVLSIGLLHTEYNKRITVAPTVLRDGRVYQYTQYSLGNSVKPGLLSGHGKQFGKVTGHQAS